MEDASSYLNLGDGDFSLGVCKDVFSEVRLVSESFLTFFTFIILNTSVCKDVLSEVRLPIEYFSTFFTFTILNTSVCKNVLSEVILQSESFFHILHIHNS